MIKQIAVTSIILSLRIISIQSIIFNYKVIATGSYKYDWYNIQMGARNDLIEDSSSGNTVSLTLFSNTTIELVMSSWWPFPNDDNYDNLINLTFDENNYLFQTFCYDISNSITNNGLFSNTIVENLNGGDCLNGQLVFGISNNLVMVEANRSISLVWPYNYKLFTHEGFVVGNKFSLSDQNKLSLILISKCDGGKTNCNDWVNYIEIGGVGTLVLTTWNNNNAVCNVIEFGTWSCEYEQYNYLISIE